MPSQVTNYQCPACNGPLHFSSSSGRLECEYCESSFTVEEVEAFYSVKDEKAAEAFAEAQPEAETAWDTSDISQDWGADAAHMKTYTCPSCGAELVCDGTTAATCCPYCGNNTIVPGQFAGGLKPDLVLPFKLDKNAAIAALKRHYQGKWLLPKAFSAENHLQEIQGVYVPFWLYDGQVDIDCQFSGINRSVIRRGNQEITNTDYYQIHRRGVVDFAKVPVDGSAKMDDAYMDSLEPFDYSELKPFSTAYLPGYLADRYDQSAEQCAKRADERCSSSAITAMQADVLGYQEIYEKGHRAVIRRGKVHYALLPVWVLHTKWQQKDYLFMMNGQTGKFVGDLPVDTGKARLATLALTAALTALLMAVRVGPAIAAMFMG